MTVLGDDYPDRSKRFQIISHPGISALLQLSTGSARLAFHHLTGHVSSQAARDDLRMMGSEGSRNGDDDNDEDVNEEEKAEGEEHREGK